MLKILLSITPVQKRWIDKQAKKHGITRTEVIRRLLDKVLGLL